MEIWGVINPILRILLYAVSFGSVGTILFVVHFRPYQTEALILYCRRLIIRSALLGIFVSLMLFLSVAGNLGGDLESAVDLIMLKLAFETKAGFAALIALIGFSMMALVAQKDGALRLLICFVSGGLILVSFLLAGHTLKGGVFTQIVLFLHLVGISFWVGSFFPFRWMSIHDKASNLQAIALKFGTLGIGYVGLLFLAGCILAYNLVGGFMQLMLTSYGQVLLVKIALVSFLLSLGALNKLRLVPLMEKDPLLGVKRFKASVHFEIIITFFILLLSSFLTTSLIVPMDM